MICSVVFVGASTSLDILAGLLEHQSPYCRLGPSVELTEGETEAGQSKTAPSVMCVVKHKDNRARNPFSAETSKQTEGEVLNYDGCFSLFDWKLLQKSLALRDFLCSITKADPLI